MAASDLGVGLRDDLFVAGTLDFVKATLDTKDGAGLSAQASYKKAMGIAGGSSGVSHAFADITSIRTAIEATLSPSQLSRYETDIKPFVVPFDSVAAVSHGPSSGTTSGRLVLVFK